MLAIAPPHRPNASYGHAVRNYFSCLTLVVFAYEYNIRDGLNTATEQSKPNFLKRASSRMSSPLFVRSSIVDSTRIGYVAMFRVLYFRRGH